MLLFVPSASADVICGEAGTGAGQVRDPRGIAFDESEGLLYVAEAGNDRVSVFDEDCGFVRAYGWGVDSGAEALEVCTEVSGCQAGIPGDGRGQFNSPRSVAVDEESEGKLYVYDAGNRRVQRMAPVGAFVWTVGGEVNETSGGNLCPRPGFPGDACNAGVEGTAPGYFNSITALIAMGPGGIVHAADNIGGGDRRVQKFDSEGNPVESCASTEAGKLEPGGFGGTLAGFAVAPSGDLYLANGGGTGAVRRYDPGCGLLAAVHPAAGVSFNIQSIATDGAGNLYVADNTEATTATYRYDATNTLNRVFYGNGTQESRAVGLAPHSSAGGDIFVSEDFSPERVLHISFPPPGPVVHPDPKFTKATEIGNVRATLNAKVNPEGEESAFFFEYLEQTTFEESGFTEAIRVPPSEAEDEAIGSAGNFDLHDVSEQIGCAEVEDPPQPSCLKPETTYRFRVTAKNASGQSIPREGSFETREPFETPPPWSTDVGATSARLHAELNPLGVPATGHFEYVAEETFQESGFAEAKETPELDFGSGEEPVHRAVQVDSLDPATTYRYRLVAESVFGGDQVGPEALLTTHAEPRGPDTDCPNQAHRYGHGARLPDCRAYEMVSPEEKANGDIVALISSLDFAALPAELNQSAAAVPASGPGLTYSSYRPFGDAISSPYTSQYLASRGPSGWRSHGISPPREGASLYTTGGQDTQFKAFSENLCASWLLSDTDPVLAAGGVTGFPNLYRRENCGPGADVYEAISTAAPPSAEPPDYVPKLQGAAAGGSLAIFRASDALTPDASPEDVFQLYASEGGELELVSVLPGGEANDGHSAAGVRGGTEINHRRDNLHNAVSDDGSRVFWTASAGSVGPGKLYLRENPTSEGPECAGEGSPCTIGVSEAVSADPARFWTASPDGSRAIFTIGTDLYSFAVASKTAEPIAGGVSGLAGWSEDATRLYLVSSEALAPGAVGGEDNLYLHESGEGGGDFFLVATLEGGTGAGECAIDHSSPVERCAQATPDGRHLAFMSDEPLTGYDNTDADSGKPDTEVFLYDSTAEGGEGALRCVSCNPTGSRPEGEGAVAAQIPTWASSFQTPRALSADGKRLFFESHDRLVLGDISEGKDVYQWEAAGKGGCEESDANFFAAAEGCIELISSGQSPTDAQFVDASAGGSDVFFKTNLGLVGGDSGLIDIYDARIGGGYPPPPPPEPECEGEACQSPPGTPSRQTPSSSAFLGTGNPAPPQADCATRARKAKRLSRRAKAARRAARRARNPRRTRAMARKARRLSKRARRLSRSAKRCRRAGKANKQPKGTNR